MTINLVNLLVGLLVFFLIAYGVRLALRYFAAPQPVEMIVMLILLVLFIFWLLGELGIRGPVIHLGNANQLAIVREIA